MKQNEISALPKLDIERIENIFNVYQTEEETGKKYYYNILQTIAFPQNLPPTMFQAYNIQRNDTWPLISFKFYNTPNLWWLILLANNIVNPIKFPDFGEEILIPTEGLIKLILAQIK